MKLALLLLALFANPDPVMATGLKVTNLEVKDQVLTIKMRNPKTDFVLECGAIRSLGGPCNRPVRAFEYSLRNLERVHPGAVALYHGGKLYGMYLLVSKTPR